jgi:hypothetical protein
MGGVDSDLGLLEDSVERAVARLRELGRERDELRRNVEVLEGRVRELQGSAGPGDWESRRSGALDLARQALREAREEAEA